MNKKKIIISAVSVVAVIAVIIAVLALLIPIEQKRLKHEKFGKLAEAAETDERAEYIIEHYEEYPEYITQLFYRNPEKLDFVYNYAFCKDNYKNMTYTDEEINTDKIPALYMFDDRWAYETIGSSTNIIKTDGCAYVSLTMAYLYLKKQGDIDPVKLGSLADEKELCGKLSAGLLVKNIGALCDEIGLKGTYHNFDVEEGGTAIKDISDISELYSEDCVLIAGMYGDTFGSHALVIREIDGNTIYFNDPANEEKTAQAWNFDDIKQEFMAIWVITNK